MKFTSTLALVLIITANCFSAEWKVIPGTGQLSILKSSNSMFPHPSRANGHTYKDSLYCFENHYNDSSIAVFLPENYQPGDSTDVVFYFHGWNNNIRKSIKKFELLKQFSQSGKNAILVFPEGPKNAPDSFGGKLEEKDVFFNLVGEILDSLLQDNKIISTKPGRIILAGHSGAYRVISYILNRGGLTGNISEVYLFDALYGQMQKYTHWLECHNGRLVNISTPNGGTHNNSLEFLSDLTDWNIPFYKHYKNDISESELKKENIIFILSSLSHSNVINPYFNLFLKTSKLKSN